MSDKNQQQQKKGSEWSLFEELAPSNPPPAQLQQLGSMNAINKSTSSLSGPFPPSTATNASADGKLNLTPEEEKAYSHFFKVADLGSKGVVGADSAVAFMMKSGLNTGILGEVWQNADTGSKGYLTRDEFYKALKLIAIAQSGKGVNPTLLHSSTPVPSFEGMRVPGTSTESISNPAAASPFSVATHGTGSSLKSTTPSVVATHLTGNKLTPQFTGNSRQPVVSHATGSTIGSVATHATGQGSSTTTPAAVTAAAPVTPEERQRLNAAFQKCSPVDGYVSGEVARDLFMKSQLPNETLAKIWQLVDTSGAGRLNSDQFLVAMWLITRTKQGLLREVPRELPRAVWDAVASGGGGGVGEETARPGTPGPFSPVPTPEGSRRASMMPPLPHLSGDTAKWIIPPGEVSQSTLYFQQIDKEKKGFVTGQESFEFFVKSGLPQTELAQIWDLSCIETPGRLRVEEFAVAMWLIRARKGGRPIPSTLPMDLVPPILRGGRGTETPATPAANAGFSDAFGFSAAAAAPSGTSSFTTPGASSMYTPGQSLSSPPLSRLPTSASLDASIASRQTEVAHLRQSLTTTTTDIASLRPQIEVLRQQRTELDREYRELSDKRNELVVELSTLRAVWETEGGLVEEVRAMVDRERGEVGMIEGEVRNARVGIEGLKHAREEMERELEEVRGYVNGLRAEVAGLRTEYGTRSSGLSVLREEVEGVQRERGETEMQMTRVREELSKVVAEAGYEKAKVEQERGRLERVKQQLVDAQKHLEQEQARLEMTRKERVHVQAQIDAVNGDKARIEKETRNVQLEQTQPQVGSSGDGIQSGALESAPAPPAALPGLLDTSMMSVGGSVDGESPKKSAPPPPPPASKKPNRKPTDAATPTGGAAPSPLTPTMDASAVANHTNVPLVDLLRKGSTGSTMSSKSKLSSHQSVKEKDEFDALFEANLPRKGMSQSVLDTSGLKSASSMGGGSEGAVSGGAAAAGAMGGASSARRASAGDILGSIKAGDSASVKSLGAVSVGGLTVGMNNPVTTGEGSSVKSENVGVGMVVTGDNVSERVVFEERFPAVEGGQIGSHGVLAQSAGSGEQRTTEEGDVPPPVYSTTEQAAANNNNNPSSSGTAAVQHTPPIFPPTLDIDQEFQNAFATSTSSQPPSGSSDASASMRPVSEAFDFGTATTNTDEAFKFDTTFETSFVGTPFSGSGDADFGGFQSNTISGGGAGEKGQQSRMMMSVDDVFANAPAGFTSMSGASGSGNVFAAFDVPQTSTPTGMAGAVGTVNGAGGDMFGFQDFGEVEDVFGTPGAFSASGTAAAAATGDAAFGFDAVNVKEQGAVASAGETQQQPPQPPQQQQDDAEEVKSVMAMGFTKQQAITALESTGWDVAKAVDSLLQ
ncbi:hypothetical protein HDU85_005625 [Gaertneriomyces sp. JEL0708]|nr:hypothetical protein HDU85_005625 [Gaertneriomyces sp. JEL0708]